MFAKVENSPRLKAVLEILRRHRHGGITGLEICRLASVMNPGECASELRKNGYEIEAVEEAKSPAGRRVFRYRLTGEPDEKTTASLDAVAAESQTLHDLSQAGEAGTREAL